MVQTKALCRCGSGPTSSLVASLNQSAYLTRHHALYQVSLSTSLKPYPPHLTSTRKNVWYWSLEDEKLQSTVLQHERNLHGFLSS